MLFSVLTIFPDLLQSPLQEGMIKKARENKLIHIDIHNLRDFATDKHSTTDDRPYGGGEGMVMKPEPLAAAVTHVRRRFPDGNKSVILLSPQGRRYDQTTAERLSRKAHVIMVCGRYEGVDERFTSAYVDEELSLGDYILTGGELAALVVIDSITRLIPGVLGCSDSFENETFSRGLLKHPQYTRPRVFEDISVPGVLLSGDHEKIEQYRLLSSIERTMKRRPDLLKNATFSRKEIRLLREHGLDSVINQIKSSDGKNKTADGPS